MDKQKQIEEMAKIICKSGANNADCDKCGFNRECSKFKDAKAIYNAGYRKIPENAVVLTIDEINKKQNEAWDRGIEVGKGIERKETVEKYFAKLKERFVNTAYWMFLRQDFDEIYCTGR